MLSHLLATLDPNTLTGTKRPLLGPVYISWQNFSRALLALFFAMRIQTGGQMGKTFALSICYTRDLN